MTVREAREAIKPPLKFGDARQIEARKTLAVVAEFESYRKSLPKDQAVRCQECRGEGIFECGEEDCDDGKDGDGKLCATCLGTMSIHCGPCNGGGTMLARAVDIEGFTAEELTDWMGEIPEILDAD